MIYRIDETTSTNDEARDAKYRHGDIVWAERQTAGRGQRGQDRKSTRLNSSHKTESRMPSSA